MEDPLTPPPLFPSIICGTDNGAAGVAARRQAAWLAEPDSALELIPAPALTGRGPAALADRCEGHDLLVLGSEPHFLALIRQVRIPLLLARWCAEGRDVTDEILVVVGDQAGSSRAAGLAARIARRHRGSVSVVAAPGRFRDLEHALAVSERVILRSAGTTPRVLGELAPPELAVPAAAAEVGASLLVVGVGDDAWNPAVASDIARRAGCSLLTVPAPTPALRRFTRARAERVLVPA